MWESRFCLLPSAFISTMLALRDTPGGAALSASAILASFLPSRYALRRAIEQCDDGTIFCQPPGGFFSKLTRWLNVGGAILFFLGVCLMAAFVSVNLVDGASINDRQEATKPATASNAAAATKSLQGQR